MSVIEKIFTAENLLYMLKGAGFSLLIAVCALIGGSVLGLLAATLKMSTHKLPKIIANI